MTLDSSWWGLKDGKAETIPCEIDMVCTLPRANVVCILAEGFGPQQPLHKNVESP